MNGFILIRLTVISQGPILTFTHSKIISRSKNAYFLFICLWSKIITFTQYIFERKCYLIIFIVLEHQYWCLDFRNCSIQIYYRCLFTWRIGFSNVGGLKRTRKCISFSFDLLKTKWLCCKCVKLTDKIKYYKTVRRWYDATHVRLFYSYIHLSRLFLKFNFFLFTVNYIYFLFF